MKSGALKIKLISPKMSLRPMDSELKRRMSPPLSLVTLATLTPKPHLVYIEDENIEPINFSDSPDLVGITVNVDTSLRAFEISRKYRDRGIHVVFGGIHASSNPGLMADHCDSVCIGEAEDIWHKIIGDFLSDKLQKSYCHTGSTDLKKVPVLEWKYIRQSKYLYNNIVQTSRGCPFKCNFCYNSCKYINRVYRHRPIEDVVDEIKKLNTRQVMIIDDNFIGNVEWTKEFAGAVSPLRLIWHSAVSANIVHYPDLIAIMAASGCRSLFIGFESINGESIKSVNKGQNKVDDYEMLIKLLHDNNIMVNASLVFGFDHDTAETFPRTLDWLIKNKVETMTSHILTPYPGTILYKQLKEENRITDYDFRKYNTSNVVFKPKNMTALELKKGYLKIYDDFYSLKSIIRRRPEKRKLLGPYYTFNLGYRKYGKITAWVGKMGFMRQIGKLGRKLAYGIE